MTESSALYLGLISGTSADGIDAALASFSPSPKLHAGLTHPYPDTLRRRILDLAQGDGRISLDEFAALDIEIAREFAHAAQHLLDKSAIAATAVHALGAHGQTVRHRPQGATPFTLQLGDPNVIAEATGILTIADFRRRDVAAGGQGAPLAPVFHAAILPRTSKTRVVLNLGGIANVTILPADPGEPVRGFDTGPANCLLDAWTQRHLGRAYDANGSFAASGQVNNLLLAQLLNDAYFHASPPKSTGREMFHLTWLEQHLRGTTLAPADVQATLLALTARSIADAVHAQAASAEEVLVCGGGVHNPVLMAALSATLAPMPVRSIAAYGIDPDFVEAMLFAWLARERILGRALVDLPAVTGARGARVLGGIYFGA